MLFLYSERTARNRAVTWLLTLVAWGLIVAYVATNIIRGRP